MFVPSTVQFEMATLNSVRENAPGCRSAAQVHLIFRTDVVGTGLPSRSFRELKSSFTCHVDGDAPPCNRPDCLSHCSVAAPDTYVYTPTRLPFAPAVPDVPTY